MKRFVAIGVLAVMPILSLAQTATVWQGTLTANSWNSAGNWTNGIPNSGSFIAQFGATTNNANTTGIPGTSWTVGAIEMLSTRANPMALGASGTSNAAFTLTLSGQTVNSTSNVVFRNNSNQNFTFQPNNAQSNPNTLSIALGNSTDNIVLIDGAGGVTIGVVISGSSRKLTLDGSGSGMLTLTGANTYDGGTTISSNTLSFANGSLGSSGAITMNGGALQWHGSNTQDVSSRITMVSGKTATFDTNGNNVTFANAIGGSTTAALAKSGSGTLALSGNNSYSGGTTISAGTLSAGHNSALGSGSVTVSGGTLSVANGISLANTISLGASGTLSGTGSAALTGSLGGTGTLSGSLTLGSGANINPGNSPGILSNTGTLTFDSGSTYTWELAALSTTGAGTNFDQIANTGTINLSGGTLTLSLGSFAPSADSFWATNQSWTVISSTGGGSITGTAMSISNNQSAWSSWGSFATAFSGQSMTLNWTANAIPEPSTYAAIVGVLALGGVMWQRRRKAKQAS